ncbi:MAG: Rpn family recombination-promoting nuclease/putative transposase [Gammaproteobacteria bacterium]|nr:Rpn family recombination-promoting nuclease/putative transposase [Gammaproteobacteria bacterium]
MANRIHQASDKLFKQSMANLKVAEDFFKQHLDIKLYRQIDWQSLRLDKETFIDRDYKAHAADMVYQVKTADDKAMYFYLLCEHQSKVDRWMALRIFTYVLKLIERHHKQHPNDKLAAVYPMVIYSGRPKWTASQDLYDLFGEQGEWAREYLTQYQLIDIHRLEDQDLRQRLLAGVMQYSLKYQKIRELKSYLKVLIPWLERLDFQGSEDYAVVILSYVVDGLEDDSNKDVFTQLISQISSEKLQDEAMTLAQQFRQEGFEKGLEHGKTLAQEFKKEGFTKGIEKGVEQGVQQGRRAERIALARKMLCEGLDVSFIQRVTELSKEEMNKLYDELLSA